MKNKMKVERRGYLWALFNNKCPQCRKGNLFLDKGSYHLKSFMKMHEKCPVCGQATELEQGFYYGTGYVSYALTVAFSLSTFIVWWLLIGISVNDNRIFWWMGTNAILLLLLQPFLMRLSRTFWLAIFVKYNANWETEQNKIIAV